MTGRLSCENSINLIRSCFLGLPDTLKCAKSNRIKLIDCLMSALAIFNLKYPSLLQFDHDCRQQVISHNLAKLYKVQYTPSDTYMRERLDEVDSKWLRKAYKSLFAVFQRSNYLKLFEFRGRRYLLSLDGTGYFSSTSVHCENCCEKHHRDGRVNYYHHILSGALVHPDYRVVIPFAPEPIIKTDGTKKNDCERRAAERFLDDFRREHPHLQIIVVADGLFSNAPFINRLRSDKHSFIIVAKEGDHKLLLEEFNVLAQDRCEMKRDNTTHRFRFMNDLSLNDSNLDCKINVLEYWEIPAKGKSRHWVWVTDIPLTKSNVYDIMLGGRSRWKIENETFNTLKNQGYHFEHNFGHGKKHLSTVFAYLMLLAFFVDQLQQLCCSKFKKALTRLKTKANVWREQRGLFIHYFISSWEDLMLALANGHQGAQLQPDTS